MDIVQRFLDIGEYLAAGLYEEPERSLFYRYSLGLRRYWEKRKVFPYKGRTLYPSGPTEFDTIIKPDDNRGIYFSVQELSRKDPQLALVLKESDFCKYRSSVPKDHVVAGDMWTHSMPNYERVLEEGLDAYEKRIRQIMDAEIREGLLHLLAGIRNFAERSSAYLEEIGAEPRLIQALKKVPFQPANSLYEAIVGWNFVMYLDNVDNLGCLAAGLLPYYRGENIVEELKNLYDNLNENVGYSMSLDGSSDNPLVLQCLEAVKGKRRPMIELLVDEHTPMQVWEKAAEVVRTQGGQPAFYNRNAIYDGFLKRFPQIQKEDVTRFCGGGCTEGMLAGLSNVGSLDAGINLPLILTQVIDKKLAAAEEFEDFYKSLIEEIQNVVDRVTEGICISQRDRAKYNPQPMRTLLIDDCIEKGMDYNNGGARYMWSIINFAGMINVIDSMLVIRDFVFRQKRYTGEQVVQLLKADDEAFLTEAKNHPIAHGVANEEADAMAKRISTDVFSMLDEPMPYMGYGFLPSSIQFNTAASAGKGVGATPDGRKSGSPLNESLGAILNKDVKGPTAMLKSVTSLDLGRALGIPVVNLTIHPNLKEEVLIGLIKGYIAMGGIQLQISCVSRKILEDAYENPDHYKNLVVRVGGYSDYFCKLSDDLQRLIIERTIYE